jgi:4-amino-4-deoxy-L-arabinose transferase-like glycosyltransferase
MVVIKINFLAVGIIRIFYFPKTQNMKKLAIASIVGGIIIFIYQTLSWTVLNLHQANQEYTPKQDTILAFMNQQFSEDGSYLLPYFPKGTSSDDMQKLMQSAMGKPWMQIQYHKVQNMSMGANIAKGLVTDILIVALLCWILIKMTDAGFGKIFMACLITGIIVFLNSPFTVHIWYPKADIGAHFTDAVISWGLCGIWLGWFLNRRK